LTLDSRVQIVEKITIGLIGQCELTLDRLGKFYFVLPLNRSGFAFSMHLVLVATRNDVVGTDVSGVV
jgi:hypothetical protein